MAAELKNETDPALARRSQAGCLESFEELVRRYESRIYGFARTCSGRDSIAREVTQEAFVKAFQSLRSFDPRRSFKSWLFGIARNLCADQFRCSRRFSEEPVPERVDEENPASLLERREARGTIWETARQNLTLTQFQALWLHYAEELPVADVARAMRKTRPHVKVLLFRARQRLLRQFEADAETSRELGLPRRPVLNRPSL